MSVPLFSCLVLAAPWTRRGLAADELSAPQFDTMFPTVLSGSGSDRGGVSANELIAAVAEHKALLREDLHAHGAILFRGFDIRGAPDFERVLRALDLDLLSTYKPADAKRTNVTDYVFTAADAPGYHIIPPHHEQAYSTNRPGVISFFCERPPADNGETPIFKTLGASDELSAATLEVLRAKPIVHKRTYHSHTDQSTKAPSWRQRLRLQTINFLVKRMRLPISPGPAHHPPWQRVFQTESASEAVDFATSIGVQLSIDNETGVAKYAAPIPIPVRHPVAPHPEALVWQVHTINDQALVLSQQLLEEKLAAAAPPRRLHWLPFSVRAPLARVATALLGLHYATIFSDGAEVPKAVYEELTRFAWKHSTLFTWRAGDILVLDNAKAMHMRMPSTDPKRRILTALANLYRATP